MFAVSKLLAGPILILVGGMFASILDGSVDQIGLLRSCPNVFTSAYLRMGLCRMRFLPLTCGLVPVCATAASWMLLVSILPAGLRRVGQVIATFAAVGSSAYFVAWLWRVEALMDGVRSLRVETEMLLAAFDQYIAVVEGLVYGFL